MSEIEAFIELRFAPGTQVAEVDTAAVGLPELVESFTLAGDPDALVRCACAISTISRRRRPHRRARAADQGLTTRTVIVLGRTPVAADDP